MNGKYIMAHSFVAVLRTGSEAEGNISENILSGSDKSKYIFSSTDNRFEIMFTERNNSKNINTHGPAEFNDISLILGDDCEWPDTSGKKCMANGISMTFDMKNRKMEILTSIVGLPPLFLYKDKGISILTSDIYLLAEHPGVKLKFDPEGIADLFVIGHPILHRTLFRNCIMVTGGYKIEIGADGDFSLSRAWTKPEVVPLSDWGIFVDMQTECFKNAIKNLDLHDSFLSLTGGLDTRAILSEFIKNNRKIPSYTMSGPEHSLDARIAKKLSETYGLDHRIITIDEDFHRDLPKYVEEASRFSGGLYSIEQATEVYFYRKIGRSFHGRVSGNLGNQIGRRGTEKISLKGSDTSILEKDLIGNNRLSKHWYNDSSMVNGRLDYTFLLQNEVPFSSVGNYCIGNHFAVQQSPYSNCNLIDNTFRMPSGGADDKHLSILRLRLNDLRHRFLGESESGSFQRKLIRENGGYASYYPINWGWRAAGGVSVPGLAMGVLTFMDALAHSRGLDDRFVGKAMKKMNISGLHEFRKNKIWIDTSLREYVRDTLSTNSTRECGMFNYDKLQIMLEEHYSAKSDHSKTLLSAMDLALARNLLHVDV